MTTAPSTRPAGEVWNQVVFLERDGKRLIIFSWGPDGQEGTDDDIRYPPEKDE